MPHFLITAADYADGLDRRVAHRDAHLARIAPLKEAGRVVVAGPTLDDAGRMTGSVLILAFDSQAELESWLAEDPYVAGKVWEKVAVTPMKVAIPAL